MLSKHALEEYKEIHLQETGKVFPDDVLLDEAIKLLTLFDYVYRPIKKEWLKEYGRNNIKRGMAENSQSERKILQKSSEVRESKQEVSRASQE